MASTYMDGFRGRCKTERDAAIAQENAACNLDVYNLEQQKRKQVTFSENMGQSMILGVIVGIVLCFAMGAAGIVVGIVGGLAVSAFSTSSQNARINQINQDLAVQQEERKKLCQRNCANITRECDRKIDREVEDYKKRVAKARQVYGGSTVIDPLIGWVADHFEKKIRAADRASYAKTITAELTYQVAQNELMIMERLPHSGGEHPVSRYSFFVNRFHDLPDFHDRVGFAQALSKRVQFEILSRFPQDPIAPASRFKPSITIEYDDTHMRLIYTVDNPNYRAAVHMHTGVGNR